MKEGPRELSKQRGEVGKIEEWERLKCGDRSYLDAYHVPTCVLSRFLISRTYPDCSKPHRPGSGQSLANNSEVLVLYRHHI